MAGGSSEHVGLAFDLKGQHIAGAFQLHVGAVQLHQPGRDQCNQQDI
jgi:hypothetical protein